MRILILSAIVVLSSCTSVATRSWITKTCTVINYTKGMRAVGRSALSATTGVVVRDVCDTMMAS